nr:sucrose synthase 6-like [Tanacetum cinerariifolium]
MNKRLTWILQLAVFFVLLVRLLKPVGIQGIAMLDGGRGGIRSQREWVGSGRWVSEVVGKSCRFFTSTDYLKCKDTNVDETWTNDENALEIDFVAMKFKSLTMILPSSIGNGVTTNLSFSNEIRDALEVEDRNPNVLITTRIIDPRADYPYEKFFTPTDYLKFKETNVDETWTNDENGLEIDYAAMKFKSLTMSLTSSIRNGVTTNLRFSKEVPITCETCVTEIRDALEVDDRTPNALCMLGDLELKNELGQSKRFISGSKGCIKWKRFLYHSLSVIALCPNNNKVHIYKEVDENLERIHVLQKVGTSIFVTGGIGGIRKHGESMKLLGIRRFNELCWNYLINRMVSVVINVLRSRCYNSMYQEVSRGAMAIRHRVLRMGTNLIEAKIVSGESVDTHKSSIFSDSHHHPPATTIFGHPPPPEKFFGESSGQNQKCSPPPDLSDPIYHSLSRAAPTYNTTSPPSPTPPSSSPSPLSPPPPLNHHIITIIITTLPLPRSTPPPHSISNRAPPQPSPTAAAFTTAFTIHRDGAFGSFTLM